MNPLQCLYFADVIMMTLHCVQCSAMQNLDFVDFNVVAKNVIVAKARFLFQVNSK